MTDRIINDMIAQITAGLSAVQIQAGVRNDVALDHIARAMKQLEALRYHVFNLTHRSGEVK